MKKEVAMTDAKTCPISGLTTLILATDGSGDSENAMKEAINLARACNTRIIALSVVDVNPEYEALAPKAVEKAETDAKDFVDNVKECASRESVSCEPLVVRGQDPARSIIEEAERLKGDMIIMGRHGRKKGVKKLLMGSVSSAVVSNAPCKVLVVP